MEFILLKFLSAYCRTNLYEIYSSSLLTNQQCLILTSLNKIIASEFDIENESEKPCNTFLSILLLLHHRHDLPPHVTRVPKLKCFVNRSSLSSSSSQ